MRQPLKSPAVVRAEFDEHGVSIRDWCKAHGQDYQTVLDVLHGRSKGQRGKAHRAAVALGIKRGRVVDPSAFKPTSKARAAA